MTDNFSIIFKILSTLERAMDYPELDISALDAKKLKVSEERWCRYIEMLADAGYIKGASIREDISGDTVVDCDGIRITLKGLEYLAENSFMKKAYKAAKGIADIIP